MRYLDAIRDAIDTRTGEIVQARTVLSRLRRVADILESFDNPALQLLVTTPEWEVVKAAPEFIPGVFPENGTFRGITILRRS
jgi:hypothetical protein